MDACTAGDAAAISVHLTSDAVHYFPPDMYDGPWRGAHYIGQRWAELVRTGQSAWTVDEIAVDPARDSVVCEWTHFKQRTGIRLRGTEWYRFDAAGLITEIRAYYASPQDQSLTALELGGFDYRARGYPLTARRDRPDRLPDAPDRRPAIPTGAAPSADVTSAPDLTHDSTTQDSTQPR
jgi:hypothetical protein